MFCERSCISLLTERLGLSDMRGPINISLLTEQKRKSFRTSTGKAAKHLHDSCSGL